MEEREIKIVEIDGKLRRVYELAPKTYQLIDEEEVFREVFLHISLTDGDGLKPIGITNDGVSKIHVTLRQTSDPKSDVILLSGKWRIPIRDDRGHIYDMILVNLVDGVTEFDYTITHRPAICKIDENDFEIIEISGVKYKVRIVGDNIFKVYRALPLKNA